MASKRGLIESLLQHAAELMHWMERCRFASHDWYDIWATPLGEAALNDRNRARPLIGPILRLLASSMSVSNKYVPELPQIFLRKTQACTSMGLIASSCFQLYELTRDGLWLTKGREALEWLLNNRSRGYSGAAWGLPFDWLFAKGLMLEANTPCSTVITYIIDAFLEGYRITGDPTYGSTVLSSRDFLINDLSYEKVGEGICCVSYTPLNHCHIVNPSSYVAAALLRAYELQPDTELRKLADSLVNYVLSEQDEDGSWNYWGSGEDFPPTVDAMHQCYIIQNLLHCLSKMPREDIRKSVANAVAFFRGNLLTENFLVSSFPSSEDFQLIDQAEGIAMFTALGDLDTATRILRSTRNVMGIKGRPYYCTGVTRFRRVSARYIRWGHAQLLHSILDLTLALRRQGRDTLTTRSATADDRSDRGGTPI